MDIIIAIWRITGEMAPWLLLGFLIGGVASIGAAPKIISKQLGGGGWRKTIKAALIGVPLPLCSCGIIPVAAAIRKAGAGKGPTVSFLASTPQTGVDSIAVTWGMLGPVFAVFRVIVAFISGVFAGSAVDLFDKKEASKESDKIGASSKCCSETETKSLFSQIIRQIFIELPAEVAKPLIFGLIISGLISALIPENYLTHFLGNKFLAMLVMTVMGIPLYVCSTASVPMAMAFIRAGIAPGAALVFLIVGPATNSATIAMIWKNLGKTAVLSFLSSIILCAWVAGLIFDWIEPTSQVLKKIEHCHIKTPYLANISSIILILILINAFYWISRERGNEETESCCCSEKD